jgi:hypothetical protein
MKSSNSQEKVAASGESEQNPRVEGFAACLCSVPLISENGPQVKGCYHLNWNDPIREEFITEILSGVEQLLRAYPRVHKKHSLISLSLLIEGHCPSPKLHPELSNQ